MSDIEPIVFRPRQGGSQSSHGSSQLSSAGSGVSSGAPQITRFDRTELMAILNLYGRMVAAGEWRDYAIDHLPDRAVFSVYRRSAEMPMFRIVKDPSLARRQGAYAVVGADGRILKRGHELERVLAVFDRRLSLVKA